jgi:predicted peroxiredoxin
VRRPYVVVLTAGRDDGGKRATIAISAACTAQSMDLDTHVFLVGDGSYWAYEGSADSVHVKGFPALQDLIEAFVELGGRMYVCSACDSVCAVPEGTDDGPRTRRSGVEPRGLAAVLPYTLSGGCVTF